MNDLNNLIITDIEPPFVVHSAKGHTYHVEGRSAFGLSLCISGQITYTMNGKEYISSHDHAVLLPQGGTYSLAGNKEGFFPVINFKCQKVGADEIMVFPLEDPQICIRHFETLKDMFLRSESPLKIYSVFYELLSAVFSANSKKPVPLDSVAKYIEKNMQNPKLSNSELAKHIGISEVYLRKLFLSHFSVTPKQYILDVRIRKAKQMLIDTPFSVAAIAEECGFSSVYHFCRSFKQRTHKTPTQYAAESRIYKI